MKLVAQSSLLEKGGWSPREKVKQIKEEAIARPIPIVELTTSEGEKKRPLSLAREPSVEKLAARF